MPDHQRKCHDCGNVAIHSDNIVPAVLCKKCGSQDTRLIRQPTVAPDQFQCLILKNGHAIAMGTASTKEQAVRLALDPDRIFTDAGSAGRFLDGREWNEMPT